MHIVQPLHRGVAATAQRPVGGQRHLHRAQPPAAALADVLGQPFGGQSHAEPLVEPARDIAVRQQPVGEVDVFGHGAGREAADLFDQVAPHHERGADAERGAPRILGRLHHVEERALLVDPALGGAQVVLDRIGVVVELGCLHHAHARVVEQADGAQQDVAVGREVGVEHQDVRRAAGFGAVAQAVVEVAGLGVGIVRAGHVVRADAAAEFSQPVAARVVEHPDAKIGIVDRQRRDDGLFQDVQSFVVGGDEDVHARHVRGAAQRGFAGVGRGRVVAVAAEHHDRQQRVGQRHALEGEEHMRPCAGEGRLPWGQRLAHPPGQVDHQQQEGDAAEQHAVSRPLLAAQQRQQHHRQQHAAIDGQQRLVLEKEGEHRQSLPEALVLALLVVLALAAAMAGGGHDGSRQPPGRNGFQRAAASTAHAVAPRCGRWK
ncbi:hypothetical protein FQZ97_493200 [compost metagenome]